MRMLPTDPHGYDMQILCVLASVPVVVYDVPASQPLDGVDPCMYVARSTQLVHPDVDIFASLCMRHARQCYLFCATLQAMRVLFKRKRKI